MTKRKIAKWLLIVLGTAVAVAGTVFFVARLVSDSDRNIVSVVFGINASVSAGLIPVGIGILMQAKDMQSVKQSSGAFLKVLGWYFIGMSAMILTGVIVISIVVGI